jgi:hypothetical protein
MFLQCKALEELDWATSFPEASELDRLKNDGNVRRAKRSRAGACRFLEMLRSDAQQSGIREIGPRIFMRFAPRSRLLQENFLNLDLTINVNRLVAEALQLSRDEPVVILTEDIGVELTSKETGLNVRSLPEDWLLPPETDASKKELNRLKDAS